MSEQKQDAEKKSVATIPTPLKYVFGGTAAVAAACVMHPMDLVKTRMQVASSGSAKSSSAIGVMKMAVKNDGIAGLYKGLSASVLRQSMYSTTRIGVYTSLTDYYRELYKTAPTVNATVMMAAFAGAVGAYVGTPADVGLVRMMTDARLPPADRRNYTSVFNALSRIGKEEGVRALWRGAVPTVGRAIVVSVAQLASYTQFRHFAKSQFGMGDGFNLHLVASIGSGLLTATASLPVDIAKTRIQNMKMIDAKPEYRGILDVLVKITRKEGFLALWRGYTPYVLRVVPQTILIFIILEQLNTAYFKYVLGEEYKSKI